MFLKTRSDAWDSNDGGFAVELYAWEEDIGDRHRAGVAAWLYRRTENAKRQAGWPKCV